MYFKSLTVSGWTIIVNVYVWLLCFFLQCDFSRLNFELLHSAVFTTHETTPVQAHKLYTRSDATICVCDMCMCMICGCCCVFSAKIVRHLHWRWRPLRAPPRWTRRRRPLPSIWRPTPWRRHPLRPRPCATYSPFGRCPSPADGERLRAVCTICRCSAATVNNKQRNGCRRQVISHLHLRATQLETGRNELGEKCGTYPRSITL